MRLGESKQIWSAFKKQKREHREIQANQTNSDVFVLPLKALLYVSCNRSDLEVFVPQG